MSPWWEKYTMSDDKHPDKATVSEIKVVPTSGSTTDVSEGEVSVLRETPKIGTVGAAFLILNKMVGTGSTLSMVS